jgi:plasmid stabilization system protein ParE
MDAPKRVVRHPLADEETEKAAEHYQAHSEAAARRFIIELRQTTERIRRNPRLYPVTLASTRRALLRGFPYSVIYRETPFEIQILAIPHAKRRPGYWHDRI